MKKYPPLSGLVVVAVIAAALLVFVATYALVRSG